MEEEGKKPKYGFIQYKGGQPFAVPYTDEMKTSLFKIMEEMRGYVDIGPIAVRKKRCEKCGYKEDCFGG